MASATSNSSGKRRCLYEILEVPRDASNNDIRAAYKKQARKWHPDRNFGNTEEAEKMFKEISAAYEVLSDKNERAWYDAHRDHILRGVQANQNTDDIDLVPYFSTYAFSSFDVNEPNNFYAVYGELFDQMTELEGFSSKKTPRFGSFDSVWARVDKFYKFWENFEPRRNFSWKMQYNLNDAGNRRIRKLMEKENKKQMNESKREWEDMVIKLVLFVKKRDPRVRNHLILMEKERLEKEQREREEEFERKQIMQEQLRKAREQEMERLKQEMDLNLDEIDCTQHEWNCIVCDKTFKSEQSYKNHEKSKKHVKAVNRLKAQLQLEEELFDIEQTMPVDDGNGPEMDAMGGMDEIEQISEMISEMHGKSGNKACANETMNVYDVVRDVLDNIVKRAVLECVGTENESNSNAANDSNNAKIDTKNDENDEKDEKTSNVEGVGKDLGQDVEESEEDEEDSEEARMRAFLDGFKKGTNAKGKNNKNNSKKQNNNTKNENNNNKKKRRRRKDKDTNNNNKKNDGSGNGTKSIADDLEKLNDTQSILREYHKNASNKGKGGNKAGSKGNVSNGNVSGTNKTSQKCICRACNRPFPSKSKLFKHLKEFPQHSYVMNAGVYSKNNNNNNKTVR